MYKRVRFDYEVEEENLVDFLNALKPYVDNINVHNIMNKYLDLEGRDSFIPSTRRVRNKLEKNLIYFFLNESGSLSTIELYKRMKKKGYAHNYRTFTRFLVKLGAIGFLEAEKKNKKNGGFNNVWRLK